MPLSPRRRHQPTGATPTLDREIYRLGITSVGLEGSAQLLVQASMSLSALHMLLAEQLCAPDVDVRYRFAIASQGVITPDQGGSLVGGLGLSRGSTFSYESDSGVEDDPWFLALEVLEVTSAQAGEAYPQVISWDLHLPPDGEHDDPDDEEGDEDVPPAIDGDLQPLYQLLLEALDQERDIDGPYPDLDNHLALGRRLVELTRPRPVQFMALSLNLGLDLSDWLWELELSLEDQKRHEEALAFVDELATLPEFFPEVREARASLLIELGRADEARPLVESLLSEGETPGNEALLGEALHPLIALGELRRAEALAYQLRRTDDTSVQYDAAYALAEIYRRTGRRREARKMETEAERLAERMAQEMDEDEFWEDEDDDPQPSLDPTPGSLRALAERAGIDLDRMGITPEQLMKDASEGRLTEPSAPGDPVRRDQPKVGRNDPCPCGSGKKYKKCHGALRRTGL